MNITVIYANKRKNVSSTYNIANMLIRILPYDGEIYEFFLPDDMPHVCSGCYSCIEGNVSKCGGYEFLKPINDAFEKSDLIVFAAPVYVYHTPGQVKSLLDHFGYRCMVHYPNLNMMKKQAVIVTTAGGAGLRSAVKDIKDSLDWWGIARTHIIAGSTGGVAWDEVSDKTRLKYEIKVSKTADKIVRNQKHLTPSLKVKILFYFFRELHKRNKMIPAENIYWRDMGYTKGKMW